MDIRRTYDGEGHAHFVTFSCYLRRRLLDHERVKRVVLDVLGAQLERQDGRCVGFVIMPDHVHAIVWFPVPGQVGLFMKVWKGTSSSRIKRLFRGPLAVHASHFDPEAPIWRARYDDLKLDTEQTIEEKLVTMHWNPVRAGLVADPCDWPWSSARYYEQGLDVGVAVGWPG